jgi:hypothetical protein
MTTSELLRWYADRYDLPVLICAKCGDEYVPSRRSSLEDYELCTDCRYGRNSRITIFINCTYCDSEFEPSMGNARYCSDSCRKKKSHDDFMYKYYRHRALLQEYLL